MNKFHQAHIHTHRDYFSKHSPSLLKQLSHQETSTSKPLEKKPKSTAHIQFITLQHHYYYCGTGVQQRHFEAQKDGNPKALGHDCGGCWKSKSPGSRVWWMLQHISHISLVIQAMWHVAWP